MNIIGLDIGGTKCAVSVPDGPDRVREVVRFATTDLHGTLDRVESDLRGIAELVAVQFFRNAEELSVLHAVESIG